MGVPQRPSALAFLRFTAISKLGRKLHREIARLRAAQDAIHIGGSATEGVYLVSSVGEQAAVSDKARCDIDRRYLASGRRQYDRHAMRDHECIRHDDKAASRYGDSQDCRLRPRSIDRPLSINPPRFARGVLAHHIDFLGLASAGPFCLA